MPIVVAFVVYKPYSAERSKYLKSPVRNHIQHSQTESEVKAFVSWPDVVTVMNRKPACGNPLFLEWAEGA